MPQVRYKSKNNPISFLWKSIFIFLVVSINVAASQEFSGLYNTVSPSVVAVIAYDTKNNQISQGSGFFVDVAGDVITNYHVVKGSNKAEVVTSDGNRYTIKKSIVTDEKSDLFLASVDMPKNVAYPLTVSPEIPEVGEDIVVIGCPEGLSKTITKGIISSVRDLENYGTVLQIDAAISHGSSGSPVFNKEGEVIGVATFNLIEGQNLNFAISGKQVYAILQKAGVGDAVDLCEKGEDLAVFGKNDEAMRAYNRAIEINPQYAKAWYLKAEALERDGKYDEAIKCYDKVIELNPQSPTWELPRAWLFKGEALHYQGKYDEAIKAYDKAIEIDPQLALAWEDRGSTLYRMGRYNESINSYDKASEFYPKTEYEYLTNLGNPWIGKSYIFKKLGRNAESDTAFARAKELGWTISVLGMLENKTSLEISHDMGYA
jgi:tetratricopeptide (TPR) repeat protein